MSKVNLTVRFSKAVMDDIQKLIGEGKYPSYADFVNRATVELLNREQMRKTMMDEMRTLLLSEEGKELLRSVLDKSGPD